MVEDLIVVHEIANVLNFLACYAVCKFSHVKLLRMLVYVPLEVV